MVCLSDHTVSGEDHAHPVVISDSLTTTQAFTAGEAVLTAKADGRHAVVHAGSTLEIDLKAGQKARLVVRNGALTAGSSAK